MMLVLTRTHFGDCFQSNIKRQRLNKSKQTLIQGQMNNHKRVKTSQQTGSRAHIVFPLVKSSKMKGHHHVHYLRELRARVEWKIVHWTRLKSSRERLGKIPWCKLLERVEMLSICFGSHGFRGQEWRKERGIQMHICTIWLPVTTGPPARLRSIDCKDLSLRSPYDWEIAVEIWRFLSYPSLLRIRLSTSLSRGRAWWFAEQAIF